MRSPLEYGSIVISNLRERRGNYKIWLSPLLWACICAAQLYSYHQLQKTIDDAYQLRAYEHERNLILQDALWEAVSYFHGTCEERFYD